MFLEMATYFQSKYASPKTTPTISGKNCITLSPATVLTFFFSGSLILSFNRRSPMYSPFNTNKNTNNNNNNKNNKTLI